MTCPRRSGMAPTGFTAFTASRGRSLANQKAAIQVKPVLGIGGHASQRNLSKLLALPTWTRTRDLTVGGVQKWRNQPGQGSDMGNTDSTQYLPIRGTSERKATFSTSVDMECAHDPVALNAAPRTPAGLPARTALRDTWSGSGRRRRERRPLKRAAGRNANLGD